MIGGDVITITGDNFNGVTAVYFGSWAATSFTLINDNQLTAITPVVSSAATVNITIVTPIGTSPTTDTDLFSFTSGTGVAPAGTITFFADNGSGPIQIGEPSPITAHSANVSDYSLAVGTYSITAQYNGDGNHYGTGLSTPATLNK